MSNNTEHSPADAPIISPKVIRSLHIGYEDLMLFYTDGSSEVIRMSEKCQKERREQTDAFAEAIKSSARPTTGSERQLIEQVFGIAGGNHMHLAGEPRFIPERCSYCNQAKQFLALLHQQRLQVLHEVGARVIGVDEHQPEPGNIVASIHRNEHRAKQRTILQQMREEKP
jgi:hypothetical protein